MTAFLQFVIDVLSLGGAYALMALGLVIVYGILKRVNFAYGELIMVAGYTMYLVSGSGLPWLVMAVVAVIMSIFAGIATDYVAFRPVRVKSVTAVLITSFAFSTLLQNAALLFISPRPRNVPLPEVFSTTVEFAGVETSTFADRTERLAELRISRGGEPLGTISAWNGVYPSFQMVSTRAAIRSTPADDLYVIFSEVQPDGQTAAFRLLVNPMVWWMWVSGPFVILGTVIALWPVRQRAAAYVELSGRAGARPAEGVS